jgi:hypothetical protein
MNRKTAQWRRIWVSTLEEEVLSGPGDTESGVSKGILSAASVQTTRTLKHNLPIYASFFFPVPVMSF